MPEVEVKITGAREVLLRMQRVIFGIGPAVDQVTDVNAHRLVSYIHQHIRAQGLVETGAYLNSWSVFKVGRAHFSAGTSAPQTMRLEYGFSGQDSRGRVYHQQPRPHIRPAVDQARADYLTDMRKVVPVLWGS